MKKLIIIWALLISVCYAQSKAGFYVVGGKVITVQDTSSRNYLKAIENAGVVPSVLQNAASNFLVTSEKAIGSYSLMVAQYPYIGGTAATHIFNLNKPTGLAADFTLQFFGVVNHSANGIQGNGSTGYADTKLTPSTSLTLNNTHISVYVNTSQTGGTVYDIGSASITPSAHLGLETQQYYVAYENGSSANFTNSPTLGFYLGNTIASNNSKFYKNGIVVSTNNTSGNLPVKSMLLMADRNPNNGTNEPTAFSTRRQGYASIGSPFPTDAISLGQSRIVTFFNSMQNR